MLATVIVNRYSLAETTQLANAVEELCSPNDAYGWSSTGLYCFWDFETREILYIGLAIDLPLRFQQHNGLAGCPAECCKREQIAAYFRGKQNLGFSVFVQSTLVQAISHRWEKARPGELEWIAEHFDFFDPDEVRDSLNERIIDDLRASEGAMLMAFKKAHGRFPAWNAMGGLKLKYSSERLEFAGYFLRSFTCSHGAVDPFTSRCTLVELAAVSLRERFENYLHGARILKIGTGMPWAEALVRAHDGFQDAPRIRAENYLAKEPQF